MFAVQCSYILSLLSSLLFIVYYLIEKWDVKYKNKNCPKGPWGLPLVGHLPFLLKDPISVLSRWQKRYGDIYRINLGSWETVVVNGFQSISEAVRSDDNVFSSRPPFLTQRALRDLNFNEESLVFSPFDPSFVRHKRLTSFALRLLVKTGMDSTQNMIITEAQKLADGLIEKYSACEDPVHIIDDINLAVGTISYKLFLGGENTNEDDIHVKEMIQTTIDVVLTIGVGNPVEVMPWLEYILPWQSLEYTNLLKKTAHIRDQQIANHVSTFEGNRVRDVIDAMLLVETDGVNGNYKGICSRERLLCTVQDFIGAGFGTSAALMNWFVKYMAAYPDVQQQVQAEIGVGRRIQYKDRLRLPYTDAVFHEVLRMSCVLPFAFPHYTLKDTKLSGRDITKSTVVIFNLYSIAYEKAYWGDPENFRPERFLTTDGLDIDKCNHVTAFGLGRRRCVGEELVRMQMFVLFTTLLQKCSFKHEDKPINFQPVPSLVNKPKPFRVFVKKRI